jgi:hypothetical protein
VDAFAISSYSDDRADGSILAHGTVDNIVVVYPQAPMIHVVGRFASGTFEARFQSRMNWYYQLEHTEDLVSWNDIGSPIAGTGGELTLSHANSNARGFYRVRAERP